MKLISTYQASRFGAVVFGFFFTTAVLVLLAYVIFSGNFKIADEGRERNV